MAEISDAELETLRRSHMLFDSLWNDPKHGRNVKLAVREKIPGLPMPEIDEPDRILSEVDARYKPVLEQVEATNKRLDAWEKSRQDEELDGKFRKQLDAARAKYKLTDEGQDGVIALMKERQIADPEAAAALYMDRLPKSQTTNARNASAYGGSSYANLFGMRGDGDERQALLATNPDQFFESEVLNVLNEIDQES